MNMANRFEEMINAELDRVYGITEEDINREASALYLDEENFEIEIDEEDDEEIDEEDDEELDDGEELDERVKKKKVVRGGKRVKKYTTDKDGYKIELNDNGRPKEVKMSAKEKMTRKKAGLKAARKSKGKRARSVKKRAKSMKKRIK